MHWNGYTVFSVLSGAVLVIAVLVTRDISAKDRLYGLIAGVGFIGYGIFAGSRSSGTFYFPIWIFVVPPAAVGYLVVAAVRGRSTKSATAMPHADAGRQIGGHAGGESSPMVGPGPGPVEGPHAPAERPVAWAPPPPAPRPPAGSAGPASPHD
jgi:hypothetical protein